MSNYRLLSNPCATITTDNAVIKSANLAAVLHASALVDRAAATLKSAQDAAARIEAEARDAGLASAIATFEAQAAELLKSFAQALHDERAARRNDVVQLAIGATRAIIGALPNNEMMAALAATAVAKIDADDVVEVLLGHGTEPDTGRQQLIAQLATLGVAARVDPALGRSDCVVATVSGRVIASVDVQIAGIARRWGVEPDNEA